jgi:hypothetical protein
MALTQCLTERTQDYVSTQVCSIAQRGSDDERRIVLMARFNIGDRVSRQMSPSADYVSIGTIIVVIANHHGLQIFDEYEVDFGANGILIAYDNQLKAA